MSRNGRGRSKSTSTYKRVDGASIEADVYRHAEREPRAVVIWIHGGALIMGNRDDVPEWLLDACDEDGFLLVSLDYRLAPETKLPEIVEDITDAIRWVSTGGSVGFPSGPEKIAVVGESAGGYLALTAGFRARPRPSAVVSLWGYGDLIGPWYTQPSSHPCHQHPKLSPDEAYRQVSGPPITDELRRSGDGGAFYQFCRQRGIWPSAVSGWDPQRDRERFEALMPVANVTADYPPTLLIHGRRDTDVPHDQSELMAAEFAEHGVEHQLLSIAGAEHGLDGAEPRVIDDAMHEAANFLRRHLDPDRKVVVGRAG